MNPNDPNDKKHPRESDNEYGGFNSSSHRSEVEFGSNDSNSEKKDLWHIWDVGEDDRSAWGEEEDGKSRTSGISTSAHEDRSATSKPKLEYRESSFCAEEILSISGRERKKSVTSSFASSSSDGDFMATINRLGQDAINQMKSQASTQGDILEEEDVEIELNQTKELDDDELEEFWIKNPPLSETSTPNRNSSSRRRLGRVQNPGAFSVRGRAPGQRPAWSRRPTSRRNRPPTSSSPQEISVQYSTRLSNPEESIPRPVETHSQGDGDINREVEHAAPDAEVVPQAIHVSDAEPIVYAVARTMSSKSLDQSDEKTLWQRIPKFVIALFACIVIAILVGLGVLIANHSGSNQSDPAESSDFHHPTVPLYFVCKVGDVPPTTEHSQSEEVIARFKGLVYLILLFGVTEDLEDLLFYCSSQNRAIQWLANELDTFVPPALFFSNATNSDTMLTEGDSTHHSDTGDIFVPVNQGDRFPKRNKPDSDSEQPREQAFQTNLILPGDCEPRDPCNPFGILNNETYQILQRYSMAVLYFAAAIPTWTNDYNEYQAYISNESNWLSSSHLCSWEGVDCSHPSAGAQNVTGIDLSGLELSGRVPLEIWVLIQVISFDLSNNRLTGNIPFKIGRFKRLKSLHLENNEFIGRIPITFKFLFSLETLTLQNNRLRSTIPTFLGQLRKLENLILSDNWFTGNVPAEIGNLSSLARLDLRRNRLQGTVPRPVCDHFNDAKERVFCAVNGLSCSCCTDCN